jgi:hypothetical protein
MIAFKLKNKIIHIVYTFIGNENIFIKQYEHIFSHEST